MFLKSFAQLDTLTSALISCILRAYRLCDWLHVWVFWSRFPFSAFRAPGCFEKLFVPEIDITGFGLFASRDRHHWLSTSCLRSTLFLRIIAYLGASLIAPDPLRLGFITVSRSYVHLESSFPPFGFSRPALFAFVAEFAHSDSISFLRSLVRFGFTPPVFDFLHPGLSIGFAFIHAY